MLQNKSSLRIWGAFKGKEDEEKLEEEEEDEEEEEEEEEEEAEEVKELLNTFFLSTIHISTK